MSIGLTPNDKIQYRQLANREILARLTEAVDKYPDYRFVQILWAFDIIHRERDGREAPPKIADDFYEESVDTLERMQSL